MQYVRPSKVPLPRVSRKRDTASIHARIPDWLRNLIADKGEFVLLDCGHKDNVNSRSVMLVAAVMGRGTQVFCERCYQFAGIVRHMRFTEYANIPEKPVSDIPLF